MTEKPITFHGFIFGDYLRLVQVDNPHLIWFWDNYVVFVGTKVLRNNSSSFLNDNLKMYEEIPNRPYLCIQIQIYPCTYIFIIYLEINYFFKERSILGAHQEIAILIKHLLQVTSYARYFPEVGIILCNY